MREYVCLCAWLVVVVILFADETNSYTIPVPVFFLSFISQLKIDFKNCKINDTGNDCLISVDGTDFALACCYKFKGKTGLQYEVGVCLQTSDIIWISGLHFPGLYNDLQIFQFDLLGMLWNHTNGLRPMTDTLESVQQIVSVLMVLLIVKIDCKSTSYSTAVMNDSMNDS